MFALDLHQPCKVKFSVTYIPYIQERSKAVTHTMIMIISECINTQLCKGGSLAVLGLTLMEPEKSHFTHLSFKDLGE